MATDPSKLHLYSLPNEVLVQILSPLPTCSLLPLTTVSHRFCALILRILHYRILVSVSLNEYNLMLDCLNPGSYSVKPHVFCKYLGTDGLSNQYEGEGSLYEDVDTAQHLRILGSLYSRFRPSVAVMERIGGARRFPPAVYREQADGPVVTLPIHLEAFENFSQLCVAVNVVEVMWGSNFPLGAVAVENGVVRLFRDWLRSHAKHSSPSPGSSPKSDHTACSSTSEAPYQMVWVGQNKNVGLKVRVKEKEFVDDYMNWAWGGPVLSYRDEEQSVSYELTIEELHVRTTRLFMTLEKSLEHSFPKVVSWTRSRG
ncbi:hypothetical protein BDV26DRAFT_207232 [Aspergillus bertholletiae]|uniref:F-box domain-containing protein n=1 Tax=Aspergillus bertholletiae TaxID=1226010 RepID=A0A5N7B752_9EURO|nr:hypothetical protein BDV26DRAFT_207232 [Aspergillus bertholletiae]